MWIVGLKSGKVFSTFFGGDFVFISYHVTYCIRSKFRLVPSQKFVKRSFFFPPCVWQCEIYLAYILKSIQSTPGVQAPLVRSLMLPMTSQIYGVDWRRGNVTEPHSGIYRFESRTEHWPSWGFSSFYSVPLGKFRYTTWIRSLPFLPNPFIIDQALHWDHLKVTDTYTRNVPLQQAALCVQMKNGWKYICRNVWEPTLVWKHEYI
jgi:hypothetical protein